MSGHSAGPPPQFAFYNASNTHRQAALFTTSSRGTTRVTDCANFFLPFVQGYSAMSDVNARECNVKVTNHTTGLPERRSSKSFFIDSILSPDCTKGSEACQHPGLYRSSPVQRTESDDGSTSTDARNSPTSTGKL